MNFEKLDEVNRSWVDGRTAPNYILINELAGRAEDEEHLEMDQGTRAVMWCSARRILVMGKIIKSLVIGLVVTNGFWFAHWMGWF